MTINYTRQRVFLRALGAVLALFACVSMVTAWVLGRSAPTSGGLHDATVSVAPAETVVEASEEAESSRITLTVSNESPSSVRLKEIVSHCGCTVPELPGKTVLDPGESTTIVVKVTPPSVGERRTSVDIHTASPNQLVLYANFLLKGRPLEVPYVVRSPDALPIRGTDLGKMSAVAEFECLELAGTAPWATGADIDDDQIGASRVGFDERPGVTDETVRRTYRFEVRPSSAVRGERRVAFLRLRTTSAAEPPLKPVAVDIALLTPVMAVPERVYLQLSSVEAENKFRIGFIVRDGFQPLEVSVEAVDDPWLQMATSERRGRDSGFAAELSGRILCAPPPDETGGRSVKRVLRVRTNHPDWGRIDIPLFIRLPPEPQARASEADGG